MKIWALRRASFPSPYLSIYQTKCLLFWCFYRYIIYFAKHSQIKSNLAGMLYHLAGMLCYLVGVL